ncbi:MAG: diadenylate cyclase CdaA [Deltaproteobacteria bacterium]|nr:MAG: diadenylate cyclase CdaA [Deltaproteobacteria bacterium]
MNTLRMIAHIRFQDVLDILFLTIVAYYLYIWFRGTKAFKALAGLLALAIIYTAARAWGLFLTTWMFEILWQVLIILLIILFQAEIRQVLERVDPLRKIGLRRHSKPAEWIEDFTQGIFSLAERKIGGLAIIERLDKVDEFITAGTTLEGDPTPELLLTVFQKESPLHDGAVLIREGKVVAAACYLPLSSDEELPKHWGTRHRAAIGLSQRCDAMVVVVSEERGEVSLGRGGELATMENQERFSQVVHEAITLPTPEAKGWWETIRLLLVPRWRLKLGTLAIVSLVWLMLAGQQDFEVTINVPVEFKNLPEHMEIVESIKPSVKITARGLRKDASTLNARTVQVELDVSSAKLGRKTYRISPSQAVLPGERIDVVRIEPTEFVLEFRQKEQKAAE